MKTTTEIESQTAQPAPLAQVLVVDDDTCMFDIFPLVLSSSRYAITVAAEGHLALQLAATREFDLAFVDYFLGSMNGAVISQQLRKLQPNLKVVLMSGYFLEDRPDLMEQAGACSFLNKPFSIEAAQALVERLLPPSNNAPPPAKQALPLQEPA